MYADKCGQEPLTFTERGNLVAMADDQPQNFPAAQWQTYKISYIVYSPLTSLHKTTLSSTFWEPFFFSAE